MNETLCDILEAVELVRKWGPLYEAVLKITGSRADALAAVRWAARVAGDL